MMKNLVLIILAVSLFSACKKDDFTGDPLSKFRLKEYTHDHYKCTYEYDSLNRVIKSGTYYDDGLVYDTRYFYVDDKLDSLTTYNSNNVITYETFRYIRDTIFHSTYRYSFDETTTIKFVISDNQVTRIVLPPCTMGDSSYECCYQVLHWDNNNLTYKYVYSNSGWVWPYYKDAGNAGDFPMTNTIWSAYDNHPNPLKFIFDQVLPDQYESAENNLLRMVVSDMNGDTLIRNFTHTYNEYGLPVATIETQEKNNGPLNDIITLVSTESGYVYEKH